LELLQKSCQQQQQKNDLEIETMDRKNKREEEEFERKRLCDLELFELKKQSLELDIKLKQAQLNALNLL
jgi:hypothetical protein